ncbi:MAG: nuclear transport factor 2 family protein [Acidobacteriota bacterium]|nr:nuclear transport factor 2 family protein [Acidobacteriota bacterium]
MRKTLPLIVITLLAVASLSGAPTGATAKSKPKRAASDQMIINNSRATWEAYKSRNTAAMKALTAKEYVSYTQAGASNLKQDIDTIDKLTIESYTIDEPKVTWVTKDVAILRYKCDLKGSYDGKQFGPVYSTEVWVNRGGKWQIVSYQETPVS